LVRAALLAAIVAAPSSAVAQDEGGGQFSGNWYLKVGASVFRAPRFTGSSDYMLAMVPLVSLGKTGSEARFSSRNDNISLAFVDTGAFRAGAVGKLVFRRDHDDSPDLRGLSPVRFGGEAGGFVEVYPTDWMRVRAEMRHGIRSHDGVVADFAADAFLDVTDVVRISAGPRASWGSASYFDAYYGVTPAESRRTGLAAYAPTSGLESVGFGGAISLKATERVDVSVFGEYSHLVGSASRSSLIRQRGSANQTLLGVSTTYRFGG
jgi:outer membrane protein